MARAIEPRTPELAYVWICEGEGAGTFQYMAPAKARELIDKGFAQDAMTNARDLKPAARGSTPAAQERNDYATREMRADESGTRRRGRTRH